MKLFTEIEPASYEEIQDLVQEGSYDSVEQFLRVAAQNQLAIERSQGDPTQTNNKQEATTDEQGFGWDYSPPKDVPTESPFDKDREEILLFSQYYRFFPLKCALYKLAEVTADNGGSVSIERARTYVAEELWPLREEITTWEEENEIKKQNRKSTGFPKDKEQSMGRYLDHYLGKIQRQKGEPAGFGHDLGYVAFQDTDDGWRIQLTSKGEKFVLYNNPLLDNGPENPTLSDDEKEFIISTIRQDLDEEYRFMKHVYNVLEEGEESYTNHLDEFRAFMDDSPAASDNPSDNSVRSSAGGAISRMVELGILERGQRRGWYNTKRHPDEFGSVVANS